MSTHRPVEFNDVLAEAENRAPRPLVLCAIVSGLLAFTCFLLTPILPINQVESTVSWPQNESLGSINAPLISLAPESIELDVPVKESIAALRDGETLIAGTLPASSQEASDRGLFVSAPDGGLLVTSLNEVLFELDAAQVASLPASALLEVSATSEGTSIAISGTDLSEDGEEDLRPQVTGIYSELEGEAGTLVDAGLAAQVNVNSRFTSSPTALKSGAMALGAASLIVALWALWRLDARDGRRFPLLRSQWRTFRPLDALVLAVLGFWHIFGANTSDDGYLLTMARVASKSDYMANYYRWYGVPESPFGSPYYDILSAFAQISTASMWMRLPSLLAGVATWWILSRELLPRLGPVVAERRMAHWTAALVFLSFWLPYNNGTRPEPIIALGLIATWASFERAIATERLFPAAVGTILAAFTLACGPTGLAAVGVFLISLPALFAIMERRLPHAPRLAFIAPFLAAGFAVMLAVFHDQTLATVLEATSVRSKVGPALDWYSEWVRYGTLFDQTVDGSMTRRFPTFVFFACLGLIAWALVRMGSIPGAAKGPTVRLVLIVALSTFFLMFTPTKWTHHFGIYAGIGGAVAALGAVVLSHIALRSARNRTFALAGVAFLMAVTLAGWNGWWYVSSFGVPWWDKTVQLHAVEANTVVLVIALVILMIGVFQSLRHARATRVGAGRFAGLMSAPIAIVAALMVAFSCLTFVKAFLDQAPAYSVGMGNVRTFAGNSCQLGSDVLLETNTNESFLSPIGGVALADSLDSGDNRGFDPEGVPSFIVEEDSSSSASSPRTDANNNASASTLDPSGATNSATTGNGTGTNTNAGSGSADAAKATTEQEQSTTRTSTQGNRPETMRGANGSTVRLPFNLDYTKVPMLGSYSEEPTGSAQLETAWFALPPAREDAPLVVASAAGRIAHKDINGVEQEGADLKLEYGALRDGTSVERLGEVEMLDQGPTPSWRNLRYPIADLPEEADVVRLVAEDSSLADRDWMALTPPRVPTLAPLGDVFAPSTPGLLDWSVALQYPCQRTFNHYAGVAEIPEFRIMPDAPGKAQLSGFMDFLGGGALATTEAVNYSYDIPGYLRNDWARDWGSVAKYEPRTNSAGEVPQVAAVEHDNATRWGWFTPGPMKIRDPEEKKD
ncbi:arabinosyltransferase domain-containing protein [Corynebacterium liangguodongii]|uniref:Arabinosyltransferase n=1 Tax=Corynebacterium liangguodongii TaxID=2079535 RepID=A0A2S0WBU4_9CORY|nr:arabinosyltransferase domain-containing protein [Corynebacterium liangguodongii]AWB83152.1 arabinosyltransferase [Corynebacterium liangguodongii]PWB98746.1 arabinosyltransferase [Corynebacterium liangguodongii]